MSPPRHELRWNPKNVETILRRNGIDTRPVLAKRLGLGRSTIYQAFAEDWSGTATHTVLAHLAGEFGVPITELVVDPGQRTRNTNNNTRIAS